MFELPPLQPWDAAHPLIVHLPIGILFAAPVLVFFALAIPRWSRPLSVAALAIIGLGAIGLFIAAASGEAGAQLVIREPGLDEALDAHAALGYAARTWFGWLFGGYAALTAYACLPAHFGARGEASDESKCEMRRPAAFNRRIFTLASLAYLAVYSAGLAALARAGHAGAALVHVHGVQAMMGG